MASEGSNPISCNRRPFVSDDGCDRGSVDIYQFGDLPYCDPVNPTPPDIPPEVVPTPIFLPPPPPCSCVNIKFALHSFKYSNKPNMSVAFMADGDCCEGNYKSDIDLQIPLPPCPVDGKENKNVTIGIGWGSGKSKISKKVIKVNDESCTIEPLKTEFNLNLPCPVNKNGKKVKIGIDWGRGKKSDSYEVVQVDKDKCALEPLDPEFKLNLPCPVDGKKNKKVKIEVEWAEERKGATAAVVSVDSKKCTIEPLDAEFKINLDCPLDPKGGKSCAILNVLGLSSIEGEFDPNDIFYKYNKNLHIWEVKVGAKGYASFRNIGFEGKQCWQVYISKYIWILNNSGQWVDLNNYRTIDPPEGCLLDVSCSEEEMEELEKNSSSRPEKFNGRIRASIEYGSGPQVASATYLKKAESGCALDLKAANPDLRLNLPCPVKKNDNKVKIGIDWGNGDKEQEREVVKIDESKCTIEPLGAEFKINLECPLDPKAGKPCAILNVRGLRSIDGEYDPNDIFYKYDKRNNHWDIRVGEKGYASFSDTGYGSGSHCWRVYRSEYIWVLNSDGEWVDLIDYMDMDPPECCLLDVSCSEEEIEELEKDSSSRQEKFNGRIRASIEYGSGPQVASATYLKKTESGCALDLNAQNPDLRLNLPCPVKKNDKKVEIGIDWGSGDRKQQKEVLMIDEHSCTMEPVDVAFALNLPCPVKKNGKKVKIGIDWGKGEKQQEREVVSVDSKNCTIEPVSPEFNLNLPCPIRENGKKVEIGIDWGNGDRKQKKSVIKANESGCILEPEDPEFNLNLPCPVVDTGKKVKIDVKWGNNGKPVEKAVVDVNNAKCELKPVEAQFDLKLPCPIKGRGERTIRLKAEFGAGGPQQAAFIDQDPDACEIDAKNVDMTLQVPCPVQSNGDKKLKIKIDWGVGHNEQEKVFVKQDTQNCKIDGQNVDMSLNLPCPVQSNGDKKLKIKIDWGNGQKEQEKVFAKQNTQNCTIDGQDVDMSLNLPCPIKSTGDKNITVKWKKNGTAGSTKKKFATANENTCTLTLENVEIDLGDIGGGGGLTPGSLITNDKFLTAASFGFFVDDYKFRFTKRALKITWSATGITGLEATGASSYTYINTTPWTGE